LNRLSAPYFPFNSLDEGATAPASTKTAQLYAATPRPAICDDKRSTLAVRLPANQYRRYNVIEMGNFHRFLADGAA